LGQHDFGQGPPSTILAFGSEEEEHKYINALKKTGLTTTDIDPVDVNQPKGMPRQKTDPTYNVDEDKQSIDEAQISKNIQPILVKKGYTFLGKGQDQDAYLAPDGTVLKIFGYGPGGKLSQGQQSFKDFADYCMAKPNNPFLPQFGGWEPFDFEGKRYLQINCERMFDLSKSGLILVGARLGQLASLIQSNGADRGVNKFLRRHGDQETGKLMSLVGGRQQFLLLANTIEQLDKLADRKGYRLDLHGGNFMLGSDGEIVINDPFFTGNWRFDESLNEALNQPYKILRWEKGDYGDVDAIARLDDNTFLSIMFTKGFSQDTKEEAWSVEFYRDNSQEITGKGDEFRVFATVLDAIKTFVSDRVPGAKGKYKPNRVFFSASKQVEPGQKEQSRAGLYDSLVQRYARALGFRAFRADTGNKVMYELNRIKPVAENLEEGVNDNYLYHATMPAGLMRILRTGSIKATDRPQPSTKARTQYPTISTTRSKQYAESDQFVDFLNLTNDGNAVILVFDRNAVANHYKMFGTSQGTQTVGDEYEEVIVAPRGSMPIRGTLKGFYFNPNRTAEIQEYQDVPWFQELLTSPYYMGPKQGVTEGKDFDRCFDQACKLYDRAVSKNLEPKLVQVADFQGDGNGADPRWLKLPQHVWQHYVVIVGDQVLDPTAKQFGDSMPTQYQVSDLDRLWAKQYQIRPRQGVAEATGFIPVNSKLAHDPRYVSGLTVDIKPGETQRQAKKLGWKIDKNGSPPLLMAKLQNQLKEIKAK
jgi:hypothetical protein